MSGWYLYAGVFVGCGLYANAFVGGGNFSLVQD